MSEPLPADRTWGVRWSTPAVAGVLAAVFAGWLLVAGSAQDRLVAGVGLVLSVGAAVLALTMRRRLTATADGIVVRGPAGTRRFDWSQVVAISAPTRRRRGLASTAVEVDLADDGLLMLSRTELGADPADVAAELRRYRWAQRGAGHPPVQPSK